MSEVQELEQQIELQFEALRVARFIDLDSARYMVITEWLLKHTQYGFVWSEKLQRYVLRDSNGYAIEKGH